MRAMLSAVLLCSTALSQNSPAVARKSDQGPPLRVNVLNVCTPSAEEQQELKSALARLPKAPGFSADYEISRGVSAVGDDKSAKYVRLRRDFKSDSAFATVQYSLSSDPENTIETLVFRARDVKDLLALAIEDKLSTAATKPSTVIQSDTPAARLRVERAGKTTLALARCESVDQSQYEPILTQASTALANYRRLLKLRTMLATDVSWLSSGSIPSSSKTSDTAPPSKSVGPPKEGASPR